MSKSVSAASILPVLPEDVQEARREYRQRVCRVHALRTAYAPAIIAGGALSPHNSLIDEILTALAHHELGAMRTAFDAWVVLLSGDGDVPSIGTEDDGDAIDDFVPIYAFRWAEIGYQLGLAVGTQLGPYAFSEPDHARQGGAR